MNYEFIYNANGEATGVEIDGVFFKIVGVTYKQNGQTSNLSTPNARTPTQAEIQALSLQKAGSLDTYIFNNAAAAGVTKAQTQTKNSFWEGFTADKLFSGIVTAATSIFGSRNQTQTIDPAIYGNNPYITQQPASNTNNIILLVVGGLLIYFFLKGDKKKND